MVDPTQSFHTLSDLSNEKCEKLHFSEAWISIGCSFQPAVHVNCSSRPEASWSGVVVKPFSLIGLTPEQGQA